MFDYSEMSINLKVALQYTKSRKSFPSVLGSGQLGGYEIMARCRQGVAIRGIGDVLRLLRA